MVQPNVAAEGLLICLFTVAQEVLSFRGCDYYECIGSICTCESRSPSLELPSWVIPLLIIFGILGCSCFITIFTSFCKCCRAREEARDTEAPRVRISTTPPAFALPEPSSPPAIYFLGPPSYEEVAWKPNYHPPPMDQPPAYDNIAMENSSPSRSAPPPWISPQG